MEWRLPCTIAARGKIVLPSLIFEDTPSKEKYIENKSKYFSWDEVRYRSSIKKNTKTKSNSESDFVNLNFCAKNLEERIFSNRNFKPDDLPVLGYYGTGRLWSQKKLTGIFDKPDNETFSRTFAYRDCLDPSSSYKHFSQWYTRAFKSLRDAQIKNIEKNQKINSKLDDIFLAPILNVQRAIDKILKTHTGWHQLEYSAEHEDLVLEHSEHGELKVSQLSDGIRNMLALVGDIAYRCYKLNSHHGKNAALLTKGIVMIDEVDMHLHPEWQQTVLPDLQKAFPKIQFIVTTHSPQVLSSVDAKCIRRLDWELKEENELDQRKIRKNGIRKRISVKTITEQTMGVASSDVMASVMEVDPIPDVAPARQLSHYYALIQQNLHLTPSGRALRKKLDSHFGTSHPKMLDCDRLIRLQAFKKKLSLREISDA